MRYLLLLLLAAAAHAQPATPAPAILKGNPPGGIGAACKSTAKTGYLDASGNLITCPAATLVWTVHGASVINFPWICKPTGSVGGLNYFCTPTLIDGTPISTSILTAPLKGQMMIFFPDIANTGAVNVEINGANLKEVLTEAGAQSLSSGAMNPGQPYLIVWNGSTRPGNWLLTALL